MDGKVILFCGAKGGCGCSFLTYSSASYLAMNKQKNILLLDLNTGSYFSRIVFGLLKKDTKDLGDLNKHGQQIDITLLKNLVINTECSLNIILPPLLAENNFINKEGIGYLIDNLCRYFDIVFIDFPSFLFNSIGLDLFKEIAKTVIVSSPSLVSVNNLNNMLLRIKGEDVYSMADLVINKYNLRPALPPSSLNSYASHPIKAFIPYDKDIEFLFLNKGPASIFKYKLRITSSIASYSNSLYEEIEHV